jgi:hypothetical protein
MGKKTILPLDFCKSKYVHSTQNIFIKSLTFDTHSFNSKYINYVKRREYVFNSLGEEKQKYFWRKILLVICPRAHHHNTI